MQFGAGSSIYKAKDNSSGSMRSLADIHIGFIGDRIKFIGIVMIDVPFRFHFEDSSSVDWHREEGEEGKWVGLRELDCVCEAHHGGVGTTVGMRARMDRAGRLRGEKKKRGGMGWLARFGLERVQDFQKASYFQI
jgi:hypothetical protein